MTISPSAPRASTVTACSISPKRVIDSSPALVALLEALAQAR
jgi:hypothetical protein